jgi:hypothetical protein
MTDTATGSNSVKTATEMAFDRYAKAHRVYMRVHWCATALWVAATMVAFLGVFNVIDGPLWAFLAAIPAMYVDNWSVKAGYRVMRLRSDWNTAHVDSMVSSMMERVNLVEDITHKVSTAVMRKFASPLN